MQSAEFNASAWQRLCQAVYNRCAKTAQTPMHHLFLFSQSMDDALLELEAAHLAQGTRIAQGFGYESLAERLEYVGWFAQHSSEMVLGI